MSPLNPLTGTALNHWSCWQRKSGPWSGSTPPQEFVHQPTCAEGDGVDEGPGNLLGGSLVPQGEVIGVEHALLVLGRQEVSEGERRARRVRLTVTAAAGTKMMTDTH